MVLLWLKIVIGNNISILCYDPGPRADGKGRARTSRHVRRRIGRQGRSSGRNRERLAGGAGGGNERPCAPARSRRNPPQGWPDDSIERSSRDALILLLPH